MTKKHIPHHSHTFLYRQGLDVRPSKNFVEKFREFYVEIHNNSNSRKHIDDISYELAEFFLCRVFEKIIYCIDLGENIHIRRVLKINQKITDYRHNIKSHKCKVVENIKKVSIELLGYLQLKTKDVLNKENEAYQNHIQQKKDRHIEIKKYYKEFYDKQDEWWQGI